MRRLLSISVILSICILVAGCASYQVSPERLSNMGPPKITVITPYCSKASDKPFAYAVYANLDVDFFASKDLRYKPFMSYRGDGLCQTRAFTPQANPPFKKYGELSNRDFLVSLAFQEEKKKRYATMQLYDCRSKETMLQRRLPADANPAIVAGELRNMIRGCFRLRPITSQRTPASLFNLGKYLRDYFEKGKTGRVYSGIRDLKDPNFLATRGWLIGVQKGFSSAKTDFGRALKLDAKHPLAHLGMLRVDYKWQGYNTGLAPHSAAGLHRLYQVMSYKGKHKTARQFLKRALEEDPDLLQAHYDAGRLVSISKPKERLAHLQEALRLQPKDTNTLLLCAETHLHHKNYDKAMDYATKIRRHSNDYRAYVVTGRALAAQGKFKAANDAFKAGLKGVPYSSDLLIGKARTAHRLRIPSITVLPPENRTKDKRMDWASAAIVFDLTERLFYLRSFSVRPAGEVCRIANKPLEQCLLPINDVWKLGKWQTDYLIHGSYSRMGKGYRLRLSLLDVELKRTAISFHHDVKPGFDMHSAVIELMNRLEVSLTHAERTHISKPRFKRTEAHNFATIGMIKSVNKLHKQAEEAQVGWFIRACELDPASAVSWCEKGWYYLNEGKLADARVAFEKGLTCDKRHLNSLLGSAQVRLRQSRDLEQAKRYADQVLQLNPNLGFAHLLKGDAFAQQKKWQAARARYNRSLQIDPKQAWFHERMGEAESGVGNTSAAITAYGKAITLDPKQHLFYMLRGDEHMKKKSFHSALLDYRKTATLEPKNQSYSIKAGDAAQKYNYHGEAARHYTKALSLGKDAEIHVKRARSLFYTKKYKDALTDVSEAAALKALPRYAQSLEADIRLMLYCTTRINQQYTDAVKIYRSLMSSSTTDAEMKKFALRVLNAGYLAGQWKTLEKILPAFEKEKLAPVCLNYVQAHRAAITSKGDEWEAAIDKALAADPKLDFLFENNDFLLDTPNRLFLMALINERRGLINLAFLQWRNILNDHLPTDFNVFMCVFRHVMGIAKLREDLARYIVYENSGSIYRYDFISKKKVQLAKGYYPLWSPDKTKIAFLRSGAPSLHVMDWDGKNIRTVRSNLNKKHRYGTDLYGKSLHKGGKYGWSADGDALRFAHSGRPSSHRSIVTIDNGYHSLFPKLARDREYPGSVSLNWHSVGEGYNKVWYVKNGKTELLRYTLRNTVESWKISKDGERLLYLKNGTGYSVDIKTGKSTVLFDRSTFTQKVEFPKVYFMRNPQGGKPIEKRTKELKSIQTFTNISPQVSWGYDTDMLMLAGNYATKVDGKKHEKIDRYRGFMEIWFTPDVKYAYNELIMFFPKKKGSWRIGTGRSPDWVPYSYYGILVEQATKELRTNPRSFIDKINQKILKEQKANIAASGKREKQDVYNNYKPIVIKPGTMSPAQLIARGQRYLRIGNHTLAIADFKKAIAQNKTHPAAHMGLAIAYATRTPGNYISPENFKLAHKHAFEAIQIQPKPQYFFTHGWLMLGIGSIQSNYSGQALTISLIDMLCTAVFANALQADLTRISVNDKAARQLMLAFGENPPKDDRKRGLIFAKAAFLRAVSGLDFEPAKPKRGTDLPPVKAKPKPFTPKEKVTPPATRGADFPAPSNESKPPAPIRKVPKEVNRGVDFVP